jgi:hypothetical protein
LHGQAVAGSIGPAPPVQGVNFQLLVRGGARARIAQCGARARRAARARAVGVARPDRDL